MKDILNLVPGMNHGLARLLPVIYFKELQVVAKIFDQNNSATGKTEISEFYSTDVADMDSTHRPYIEMYSILP